MPRRKISNTSPEPPTKKGPIWATPCRPCAGRMVKNPGHICRGQGENSAKCSHCVAGHHRCEDVPGYEDLAARYNLLARRESKRRAPPSSASTSTAAATSAVSTEALAGLIRRQNEILLGIRAELSAMRERSGAETPPVEDSDVHEDAYENDSETGE